MENPAKLKAERQYYAAHFLTELQREEARAKNAQKRCLGAVNK
jgi:hypothetical protein